MATRGAVRENANGLVREYLPKGMDLSKVTHQQLTAIEHSINNRPRKILKFHSHEKSFNAYFRSHPWCRTLSLKPPSE